MFWVYALILSSGSSPWRWGGWSVCLIGYQSIVLVHFYLFCVLLPLFRRSAVLLAAVVCVFQAYSCNGWSANTSDCASSGMGRPIAGWSIPQCLLNDSESQHCFAFISLKGCNSTCGISLTAVFTRGTASPAIASHCCEKTSAGFPTLISSPCGQKRWCLGFHLWMVRGFCGAGRWCVGCFC